MKLTRLLTTRSRRRVEAARQSYAAANPIVEPWLPAELWNAAIENEAEVS